MQIKVKDTRMHKVLQGQWEAGAGKGKPHNHFTRSIEVPVEEAKLVLVGGIKPQYYDTCLPSERAQYLKPILISETEKIEDNDQCYIKDVSFTGISKVSHIGPAGIVYFDKASVCYGNHELPGKVFKILALPEHFSPKHLQAIVDGKLKDGDKVLVECEKQYHDGDQWHYKIKLNSSNHITLHKIEEKMYTREQVKKLLRLYVGGIHADGWFEQNIKEI